MRGFRRRLLSHSKSIESLFHSSSSSGCTKTRSVNLTRIEDAASLERELDQHPDIRCHEDYSLLRATCNKYFEAIKYRDAVIQGEMTFVAIAKVVLGSPGRIRRWLTEREQPRLLWLLDHKRGQVAVLEELRDSEGAQLTFSSPILRAAEDPQFRCKLFPSREFEASTIKSLVVLGHQERKHVNPSNLTRISDLSAYQLALRAFPLVQFTASFDELHRQVKLFFEFRHRTPRHPDGSLRIGAMVKKGGINQYTIRNWILGKARPRLLSLLEQRAAALADYRHRLRRIREVNNGIHRKQDLARRLRSNHFMFGEDLKASELYQNLVRAAHRYLNLVALVEAGYLPSDVERYLRLRSDAVASLLREGYRPYLIRIAANIPDSAPGQNLRWLPTLIDRNDIPIRFIQAPRHKTTSKETPRFIGGRNWRAGASPRGESPGLEQA